MYCAYLENSNLHRNQSNVSTTASANVKQQLNLNIVPDITLSEQQKAKSICTFFNVLSYKTNLVGEQDLGATRPIFHRTFHNKIIATDFCQQLMLK